MAVTASTISPPGGSCGSADTGPDRPELARAAKVLQAALERAEATPTAKEKAWAIRQAVDTLLEGP